MDLEEETGLITKLSSKGTQNVRSSLSQNCVPNFEIRLELDASPSNALWLLVNAPAASILRKSGGFA